MCVYMYMDMCKYICICMYIYGIPWTEKPGGLQFMGSQRVGHDSVTDTHIYTCCCCSVAVVSDSLRPRGLQHNRLPCPSPSPRACSNSCPLSHWCHPTISSSVVPFSSGLQPFPASGSFLMTQLFASGGQSIRLSTSASGFPMNIQDWFPLGLTSSISLLSKWLSRVFSITEASIIQHSAFLWSNSHMLFNMLSWFVILFLPKSNHYIYIYTHTCICICIYM